MWRTLAHERESLAYARLRVARAKSLSANCRRARIFTRHARERPIASNTMQVRRMNRRRSIQGIYGPPVNGLSFPPPSHQSANPQQVRYSRKISHTRRCRRDGPNAAPPVVIHPASLGTWRHAINFQVIKGFKTLKTATTALATVDSQQINL